MRFEQFNHIICTDARTDQFAGKYDIKFHNSELEWNGERFKYHSSGLCRQVYVSEDRTFVIKVPVADIYDLSYLDSDVLDALRWKHLDWPIKHNILEALAYEQCPEYFKKYFAKTELLDHGWIKQEFVEVFDFIHSHDLRELGRKYDGQICLFDYDPIINCESILSPTCNSHLEEVQFTRYQYEKIVNIIKKIS